MSFYVICTVELVIHQTEEIPPGVNSDPKM